MRRVALTGGIATGKTHVRAQLERLGVPTIDADTLARDVVAPGTRGFDAVAARFGPAVVDETGTLDRRKLASIVFSDLAARRDLERIIHPAVKAAIDSWFDSLEDGPGFAVADIPLLYETGRDRDFEKVIVTVCAPDDQISRIVARDRITEAEARSRIAAQLPIDEKARRADYVIDTSRSFDETDRQVRSVCAALAG
jgi:dephospho-CoA kinase